MLYDGGRKGSNRSWQGINAHYAGPSSFYPVCANNPWWLHTRYFLRLKFFVNSHTSYIELGTTREKKKFVGSIYILIVLLAVVVWVGNIPRMLWYLNTWSLDGSIVYLGKLRWYRLAGRSSYWELLLRLKTLCNFQFALSALYLWLSCDLQPYLPSMMYSALWNHKPK